MIIELYGYLGTEYTSKIEFQRDVLALTLPEQEGYENYMNNVTNVRRREPPLISLSNNYIDFGQASIGLENYNRRPPQTVCFYNHSSINFHLMWGKGIKFQKRNILRNKFIKIYIIFLFLQ